MVSEEGGGFEERDTDFLSNSSNLPSSTLPSPPPSPCLSQSSIPHHRHNPTPLPSPPLFHRNPIPIPAVFLSPRKLSWRSAPSSSSSFPLIFDDKDAQIQRLKKCSFLLGHLLIFLMEFDEVFCYNSVPELNNKVVEIQRLKAGFGVRVRLQHKDEELVITTCIGD